MKRMVLFAILLLVLFSAGFIIADAYGYMDEDAAWERLAQIRAHPHAFWIGSGMIIGLLVIDILLPIPSSIVMTFAGALLGFWGGMLASFSGAMLAALIGFLACRYGGHAMFKRLTGAEEMASIDHWFRRYGMAALILSRPIPMLTEILSCLAGLTDIKLRTFLIANVLGTLPICALYAWAGSRGERGISWVAISIALGIPAIGWLITRWIGKPRVAEQPQPSNIEDPHA